MYYTVKKTYKINGKDKTLNILHEGDKIPDHGKEFKGMPGKVNEPIEYYENRERKSNDILVSEKLANDFTGFYYNEQGEKVQIKDINRKPNPNWRTDKPEEWERWTGTKWKTDNALKKEIEDKLAIIEEINTSNGLLVEQLTILSESDHEVLKLAELIIDNNIELKNKREEARAEVLRLRALIEEKKLNCKK